LKKIIRKSHGKTHNNSQCFKENNYKAKFLISLILKKIIRDNFRKKITKQTPKKGKKIIWKHYRNSQCFVMKATVFPHMI
jgi:hypothetical protein